MPPLVCLGSRGKLNNTPHPDHPALPRNNNRQQVEGLLEENPKFQALDKAIAKEGFKVILLLRLSPIFPFALSSYLYGATSVDFFEYMMGTLIGFFPGTLAYVYGGTVRVCIACSSRTFLFQSFFFSKSKRKWRNGSKSCRVVLPAPSSWSSRPNTRLVGHAMLAALGLRRVGSVRAGAFSFALTVL